MLHITSDNSAAITTGAPEILGVCVDLSMLATYEKLQLGGEPDLVVELIDLFVADAPRRVAVMREALSKTNWLAVKREAHCLRGSSGNVGALQVSLICEELERIESGDPARKIELLLGRLEQELEETFHVFRRERQRRLR